MGKKGLREAYKKLAKMFDEDRAKVERLYGQTNDDEYDYDYDYDDYAIYDEEPEELATSRETVEMILERARGHSRDYSEQVKFAINAIEAGRVNVVVSTDTILHILDLFPDTDSKLDKIMAKHIIVPGGFEDIDTGTLGTLFRGAGKNLDELPEQMLTDKVFMQEYLTSSEYADKEYLKGSFIECPGLTYGAIVDKVTNLCKEEVDR